MAVFKTSLLLLQVVGTTADSLTQVDNCSLTCADMPADERVELSCRDNNTYTLRICGKADIAWYQVSCCTRALTLYYPIRNCLECTSLSQLYEHAITRAIL